MSFLNLPDRPQKPRCNGLTALIDTGLSTGVYCDVVESHGQLIDLIKLGWGTAYVTKDAQHKIDCARYNGVNVCLGGTFFEKALYQNKLAEFRDCLRALNLQHVEISNGTLPLTNSQKAVHIEQFKDEFTVLSEVGYKDVSRADALTSADWVCWIEEDFAAGASNVITEARESGRSGLCHENGEVRRTFVEDILSSGIDVENVIFEAPTKALQEFFIRTVGPNVNLGNVAFTEVVGLETLRLGLRSDTLTLFEDGYGQKHGERVSLSHSLR